MFKAACLAYLFSLISPVGAAEPLPIPVHSEIGLSGLESSTAQLIKEAFAATNTAELSFTTKTDIPLITSNQLITGEVAFAVLPATYILILGRTWTFPEVIVLPAYLSQDAGFIVKKGVRFKPESPGNTEISTLRASDEFIALDKYLKSKKIDPKSVNIKFRNAAEILLKVPQGVMFASKSTFDALNSEGNYTFIKAGEIRHFVFAPQILQSDNPEILDRGLNTFRSQLNSRTIDRDIIKEYLDSPLHMDISKHIRR